MSTHGRTLGELLNRPLRRERRLITPEGVPLRIALAEPGERFGAFIVDLGASILIALLVLLAGAILSEGGHGLLGFTFPVTLFLFFVIRNLWFVIFEMKWAGSTPGKLMFGLRVIDRRGGPLRPSAIISRNLTRQVEFFFPLELLLFNKGWLSNMADVIPVLLWVAAMCILYAASPDRQRAGDFLAGTVVISVPKRLLLTDLAQTNRASFQFSRAQLQLYGIRELQVLEELLRSPWNPQTSKIMHDVCARIQQKIGWDARLRPVDPEPFLRDFYTAQRAFLEDRKNLGDERLDKFHGQADDKSRRTIG